MSARTLFERRNPAEGDDIVRVEDQPVPWRDLLLPALVVGVIAVAVAVRVFHLTALGFNSDEAVYSGQAGSLAGIGHFARSFSPFRAHPLLLQTILALEFRAIGHMSEGAARATIVATGVGAVIATFFFGRRMYGLAVGIAAAVGLAVMPYHVFISRQVLLDVPAGLGVLLAFAALYRYEGTRTKRWLYLAGTLAGIAAVTKETMIVFVPAAFVYLLWSGILRRTRVRDGVIALVLMGVMFSPFILTRFVFSGSEAGGYILYQLFREPNHPFWYFPVVLWIFVTPLAVTAFVGGFVVCCVRRTRADKLLVSWIAVFGGFFQLWPTKLLPYAIILAPAMALVGARGFLEGVRWVADRWSRGITAAVAAVAAIMILAPMARGSWHAGDVIRDDSFSGPFATDVEVQDFAGGREVGTWLGEHTPPNAVIVTMGPSLGNLVSFYGDRDFYALSVSQDAKLRNPAYRPLPNPDLQIRQMHVHYAVWDQYTADRAPSYSGYLYNWVNKYSGTPVYSVWVDGNTVYTAHGAPPADVCKGSRTDCRAGTQVRIIVFQLVGGDPICTAVRKCEPATGDGA